MYEGYGKASKKEHKCAAPPPRKAQEISLSSRHDVFWAYGGNS